MSAELPDIVKQAARLRAEIERAVVRFARMHKYATGADLRADATRVLRSALKAWRDRTHQLRRVHELSDAIDDLKLTLQLGKDVDAFTSFAQFELLSRLARDLGRRCGGWLRRLNPKGQNEQASPAQRAPILSSHAASIGATP